MSLSEKIKSKEAKVGIIGLGYVGLPLAIAVAEAGFQTTGVDQNSKKVALINSAKSYIEDIDGPILKELVAAGKISATDDFASLGSQDVICICVPTPLGPSQEPDISAITSSAEQISKYLKNESLVILESTTYPGTTEEVILPILKQSGLKEDQDFFLGFAPERVDPGNEKFSLKNTPKIVSATGKEGKELTTLFYEQICDEVICLSSPKTAEMTKLLENIFRCVNIALVNELMMLCDRMGINIWEVVEAASTKPFGFMPFYPGPGLGGHCIPVDPFYLSWKAREHDFHTEFIELAGKINERMPYYVVSKIAEALNKDRKSINGSKILILGVAYKRDISDTRESPAIKIIELLAKEGADVVYHDPYVEELRVKDMIFRSQSLTKEMLAGSDCAAIITDHLSVDYQKLTEYSNRIVDLRNVLPSVTRKERPARLVHREPIQNEALGNTSCPD